MGTLFIDRKDSELSLRSKTLRVQAGTEPARQVPAALLDRVVLRADTRMAAGVLTGLAQLDVGVVVLGGRRGERVAHVVGAPHKDVMRRVTQIQRLTDSAFTLAWCRYLVQRKLRAQHKLLQHALAARPDQRYRLTKAAAMLEKCLAGVPDCTDVDSIRGMEGAAAAGYFRGFASLFPVSLGFDGRKRRPPPDPVNACLSLAYTLLHSLAVQVCYGQGLDPMIGYLHAPAHGRASLASDLIEPWRARIDHLVWDLFRERSLTEEHFGTDGGAACLLNKSGRSRFYPAWAGQLRPMRNAMRRQANLIGKTLDDLASDAEGNSPWG